MLNWLKYFERTALEMLFQDGYLSPSEVVRIAERSHQRDASKTEQSQPAAAPIRCSTTLGAWWINLR